MLFLTRIVILIACCAVVPCASLRAETIGFCDEYFRDQWNLRLDMGSASTSILRDIPALQLGEVASISYSGGKTNFVSSGPSPRVGFLQVTVQGSLSVGSRYGNLHPIDPTKYRYFTVRMYSDQDGTAQIRWFHDIYTWAITNFSVNKGWHTYTVDLGAATLAQSYGTSPQWLASQVTGLELIPINKTGVNISLDWVQLNAIGCTPYSKTYTTGDSTTYKKLIVDDDNDYSTGVVAESSPIAQASPSLSIAAHLLTPSSYYVYGIQSGDWATLIRSNPYDMSASDVDKDVDLDLPISDITNYSFSGGSFVGTSTGSGSSDSNFYLKIPSGTYINSAIYKYITLGINYTSVPGGTVSGQIHFFDSADRIATYGFTTGAGVRNIQVNLDSVTKPSGWNGSLKRVRIDPADQVGVSFAVDYVEISQSGVVTSLSSPSKTAIGSLVVDDVAVGVLQPDIKGGRDYAQTVVGDPWNMNGLTDFKRVSNISTAYMYPFGRLFDQLGAAIDGDLFLANNAPGNGDANYYSLFQSTSMNSSDFVNICFRAWNATEAGGYNSVARIIWQDPEALALGQDPSRNGDDIIMTRGISTYCIDMRSDEGSQIEPPLPPGSPNPWTKIGERGYGINFFRIDLNENEEAAFHSGFDYIHVRADHESNTQYAIVVDALRSQNVSIYSNTSKSTSGGTLLTTLTAGRTSNVYKWDTTNVAEGTYYIYAEVTKSGNTLRTLAPGRLKISHSISQDSTPPILECERPETSSLFDSSIELAGYALDETRLATLEVFTSSGGGPYQYLTTITPDKFHKAARDLYPNYAEANNPGFQVFQDTSSLPLGATNVKLVATDTAGNETQCIRSVTKSSGANVDPLVYPTPDNVAIEYAETQPTDPPSLAASVSKKGVMTFQFGGATQCSSGTVYGAVSTVKLAGKATNIGRISSTATSKNVPPLSVKKPTKLYFKVKCVNDARTSSTITVDLKGVKTPKVRKQPLAGVLSAVKKAYKKK